MSLLKKLTGKSDAATLAERIKAAETEVAALTSEHDQAEADATAAAAADESSYAESASRAATVKARLTESQERLDRLRAAYSAQFEVEKSAFIADLRGRLEKATAAQSEGHRLLASETEAEERRHKDALAEIERKRSGFVVAREEIIRQLTWASDGVLPAKAAEAMEMIRKKKALHMRLHEMGAGPGATANALSEVTGIERTISAGPSDAHLHKDSLAAAKKKLADLKETAEPIEIEIKVLTERIRAIIGNK
ncbi:MAG: hypothetical protein HZA51_15580 [Planctomycetes bacterium]|nr:hypothetical protein [Planctomycetota bacterium]